MTWLVIGANGQLGRALIVALQTREIEFHAWGSNELDIRSESKCVELIGDLKPAVIINAAAWTNVDGAESDPVGAHLVNATGVVNLAVAAKAVGAVFAHVSTDYVFSGVSDRPWQEDDLCAPASVYGRTKAAGEVAVLREYAERSYIFRTAWLYSQWGKNFAKTMTSLALSGNSEVQVVGDQVGQPTSTTDLAAQIIDCILSGLPFGIYHATNSGQASWFDFATEVFKLSGASVSRVLPVSSTEDVRPAKRPAFSVLGHTGWDVVGVGGASVSPMRDWRVALREAMPTIINACNDEIVGR
jgi:dTDP-4-dehydrorhamnose reductase